MTKRKKNIKQRHKRNRVISTSNLCSFQQFIQLYHGDLVFGVLRENNLFVASHEQTIAHKDISSTPYDG